MIELPDIGQVDVGIEVANNVDSVNVPGPPQVKQLDEPAVE